MQLQVETTIYKDGAIGHDITEAQALANTALNNSQAKYAVSSTSFLSGDKIAILNPSFSDWQLFNGAEIFVKFDNQAYITDQTTTLTLTLKSSSTDTTAIAYPIKDSDGEILPLRFYWKPNSTVHFMFDGTNWRVLDVVSASKYNSLITEVDNFNSTIGEHAEAIDSLGETIEEHATMIDQTADSIISLAQGNTTYINPETGESITSSLGSKITQTATSIESVVANNATYTAPDGTTKINSIQSAIKQNADNIALRVEKNGVIAAINASVEEEDGSAVKISADKVEINGTAIFSAIQQDVSNTAQSVAAAAVAGKADEADAIQSVTTSTEYRLSDSATSLIDEDNIGYDWSTTIPTWSVGKYLWTRVATEYIPITGQLHFEYTPGIEQNEYGIYDSQLTTALSIANTANTNANNAAATITTTQQYRLSTSSTNLQGSGTGYEWNSTIPTWVSNTYLWTRFKIDKTTIGGTTTTSYTPGIEANEYGIYDSALTTALSTAVSAQSTANAAAPKSSAVAKTQQIYYRSNSNTKPTVYPTTWVTAETNKWNNGNVSETNFNGWRRKVTPISDGAGANVTKYLYLWTATQKQLVDGTVVTLTADDIALDDSTTVIDGGKIITGSVDANKISVNELSAISANLGTITAGIIQDGENGNNIINLNNSLLEFKNTNNWSTATQGIQYKTENGQSTLSIKGHINATSLTINDNGSSYNAWDAINITGYSLDIEIEENTSDIHNTAYLYPHLYHNGTEITLSSSATTAQKQEFYNKFLWYEGDSTTAQQGDYLNKGRILATYGDYWKVTYAFDDGATEGATPAQQVIVDPSTYITRINDNTIKVHPKNWDENTGFVQIDNQGNILATKQIQSRDDIIAVGQIYRETNIPLTSVQVVRW